MYSQIQIIGELVDKKTVAETQIRDMKLAINRIISNSNYENITVYHEIGYSYGIYSVNANSLIGEIYNSLGIINIANIIIKVFI